LTRNPIFEIKKQIKFLTSHLLFVDEKEIARTALSKADFLITQLDYNDLPFLAVAIYYDSLLWTGNLKLYKGLRRKGFKNVITAKELSQIIKGI
jgi:predicted nucleic acid-binding protein